MAHGQDRHVSRWYSVGFFLILVLALGAVFLWNVEHTVRLSNEQVQNLVDDQLALKQNEDENFPVEEINITFTQDTAQIEAFGGRAFGEHRATATVTAEGEPDYDDGRIYFRAETFALEDMLIDGMTPIDALQAGVAGVTESTGGLLSRVGESEGVANALERFGINRDAAKDTVADVAEAELLERSENYLQERVVEIEDDLMNFLEGQVVRILQSTALYDLRNHDQGWLVMAALSDVSIVNQELTATLSGKGLVQMALAALLIGALIIGFVVLVIRTGTAGFFEILGELVLPW